MLVDILTALLVALLFELLRLVNPHLKTFSIFSACVGMFSIYLKSGGPIDFIGSMDFSVWVLFVIVFSQIIVEIENIITEIRAEEA